MLAPALEAPADARRAARTAQVKDGVRFWRNRGRAYRSSATGIDGPGMLTQCDAAGRSRNPGDEAMPGWRPADPRSLGIPGVPAQQNEARRACNTWRRDAEAR